MKVINVIEVICIYAIVKFSFFPITSLSPQEVRIVVGLFSLVLLGCILYTLTKKKTRRKINH